MTFSETLNARIAKRWDGSKFVEEDLTITGANGITVTVASGGFTIDGGGVTADANISVKDDNVEVLSSTNTLDFGHAIDVTSGAGEEAEIAVDEGEFTTVVFLTGDQTISGNKTFADNVDVDGSLTVTGNPTTTNQVANKNYVDEQIDIANNASKLAIEDDDAQVLAEALRLDFGHAIDVTSGAGQEAEIAVDEGEFTTVVFLTGNQTISGNKTFANDVDVDGSLTVTGNPSTNNQVANKQYVDEQIDISNNAAKLTVQDDNANVVLDTLSWDYGHALDVVSGAGQEAQIAVDESEFTTVVFLTGDQTISGNKTFADNVVVDGDLTVNGTTTTVNTEQLLVEDNIVTLNSTVTGTPTEDSGIEVERGTETNAQLLWDEGTDRWQAGLSGSLENIILQSDLDSTTNALKLAVEDDDASVLADARILDFGHAIDVTSGSGQEAEIAVDESEFTTVLFLSGGTMTGPLTLSGNPLVANHAANKQYVDEQISASNNASKIAVEDDNAEVLTDTLRLDFGHAIDVTSGAGQEAEIAVDESEFTTVVFLTGAQTISGNKTFANDVDVDGALTVTGNPSTNNQVANKQYVDEQVSATANAGKLSVEDDDAQVLAEALTLDFGHAIDVTSGAGQEAEIAVDESEFTTVLFLSGGTMTGAITLASGVDILAAVSGTSSLGSSSSPFLDLYVDQGYNYSSPTDPNHIVNKAYVDAQVASNDVTVYDDAVQQSTSVDSLNFGAALDVTMSGSTLATIDVDESEFTTVVFLAGDQTVTGKKTFSGGAAVTSGTAPSDSNDAAGGVEGEIRWDDDYLYINVGSSTWKRTALANF